MTATAGDHQLLRRYVESASVPAFEALVDRHLGHVFSAALRRVNGDHALAKDVTQTVFVDCARKASRIPEDMPPGGWLHRHTGFVASKMIDKERRRRAREQEAATMNANELDHRNDPEWAATAPLLDAALDSLPSSDRDAIVLRFFEQRDFRSVGDALGMSDDSAQKKVSRAIDKLRTTLARRGVASTGGALATLLVANSVQTAPAALSSQVAAQSLAGAATAGGTLGGALSGLSTAARVKGAVTLVALASAAGFAGSQLLPKGAPLASDIAESAAHRSATDVGEPVPAADSLPAEPAAPEPADAMTLEELVAAAALEWRGGTETVRKSAAALGFLIQIDPKQMPEAMAIALERPVDRGRSLLVKNLLAYWAENDPRSAMAWAASKAAGVHRADLAEGLMTAWAASNPDAALGLSTKSSSGGFPALAVDESAIATVFRSMAASDPKRAIARLALLRDQKIAPALRGIFDSVDSDEEREAIMPLIAKIQREDTRIQAHRAMVEHWARRDAIAAAAYVDKAEPAWVRTRLIDSLCFTWLQQDPQPAAEWWVERAPGPDTLVKIINVWAQQDPNAAGRWLGEKPRGPASDAARMTFARQVADRDEESALVWADTVSDEEMREGTIDHIFSGWRLRNPDAADAFLDNARWPEERVRRLQTDPNTE
ncbi:MAG: sigma-70 family RNA polymerase sigma factor [Verrucomicrobiales bacterium]